MVIVKVPDYGEINFDALCQKVGLTKKAGDCYNCENMSELQLSKSIEIVIDSIIKKFDKHSKFKKNVYKKDEHSIKWEFKKHECYLAIYLQSGKLTYTVRVNTINSDPNETLRIVYFTPKHMFYYVDSLLIWILRDFSKLIYEALNLGYSYEEATIDPLPRGTFRAVFPCFIPFYFIHEKDLLTPMHYYDGYIGYNGKENRLEIFEQYFYDDNDENNN